MATVTRRRALRLLGASSVGGLALSSQVGSASSETITVAVHAHEDVSSSLHYDTYQTIGNFFDDHINPDIYEEVDVKFGDQLSFDTERTDTFGFDGWKAIEDHSYWSKYAGGGSTHTFLIDDATDRETGYGYSKSEIASDSRSYSVTNVGALTAYESSDVRKNIAIHEVLHTFGCDHEDGSYDTKNGYYKNITPMATAYVRDVFNGAGVSRLKCDTVWCGSATPPEDFCSDSGYIDNYEYLTDKVTHTQEPSGCETIVPITHIWDNF